MTAVQKDIDDHDISVAGLWLRDVISYRRIEMSFATSKTRYPSWIPSPVRSYRIVHSDQYLAWNIAAALLHLALPVVFGVRHDGWALPALPLDLLLIASYTTNVALTRSVAGQIGPSLAARIILIVAMVVNLILFHSVKALFLTRLLGPIFFFVASESAYLVLLCIARTLKVQTTMIAMLFVAVHVVICSLVAHLLLSGNSDSPITDVSSSFRWVMMVVLSSNYSAIAPAGTTSSVVVLIVLGGGLILCLNLLLSAVFVSFADLKFKLVSSIYAKHRAGLTAVFSLVDQGDGRMAEATFVKILTIARPALQPKHAEALFRTICSTRSSYINLPQWQQGRNVFDVQFDVLYDERTPIEHRTLPPPLADLEATEKEKPRWSLKSAVLHSVPVRFATNFLIVVNLWLILEWLFVEHSQSARGMDLAMGIIQILFVIEVAVRAFFARKLLSHSFDLIDLVLVGIACIGYLPIDSLQYFRVVTSMRIVRLGRSEGRNEFTSIARHLLPSVLSVLGVFISAISVFATIGYFLFRDIEVSSGGFGSNVDAKVVAGWNDGHLFNLNFTSYRTAVVTLLYALTSDWYWIMKGFGILAGTTWAELYFVLYFFVVAVMIPVVLVVLMIDEFLALHSQRGETYLDDEWRLAVLTQLTQIFPSIPDWAWVLTRPNPFVRVYLNKLQADRTAIDRLSLEVKWQNNDVRRDSLWQTDGVIAIPVELVDSDSNSVSIHESRSILSEHSRREFPRIHYVDDARNNEDITFAYEPRR